MPPTDEDVLTKVISRLQQDSRIQKEYKRNGQAMYDDLEHIVHTYSCTLVCALAKILMPGCKCGTYGVLGCNELRRYVYNALVSLTHKIEIQREKDNEIRDRDEKDRLRREEAANETNKDTEKEIRCWNRRPIHECDTDEYHIGSGIKCSECISDHIARFEKGMTCEEYYRMRGWPIYEE
jgi:hypothetical protein